MTMNVTMDYQLIPELADFGSYKQLSGNLELAELQKGSQTFLLDNGIDYNLELTNTGEGILLRGSAQANMTTECARCLEDARYEITGDVESYYVLDSHRLADDESDDEFTILEADGKADLAIPIVAAIIFELPQIVLCKEDCAGLCPKCGINLNEESCDCANAIDPDNPFSALKGLKINPL